MAEKVGTLLVESSRLTQAQADEAGAYAHQKGVSLSNALVALDMVTDAIRDLVVVGATSVEIQRRALEEGMLTLRMSGLQKIRDGVTTIAEVRRETVL